MSSRRPLKNGCRTWPPVSDAGTPCSDQADPQWQLDVMITAFVTVDEVLQEERNVTLLRVAASPQLLGDIGLYVLRPVFGGVEGDDADRVFILPLQ